MACIYKNLQYPACEPYLPMKTVLRMQANGMRYRNLPYPACGVYRPMKLSPNLYTACLQCAAVPVRERRMREAGAALRRRDGLRRRQRRAQLRRAVSQLSDRVYSKIGF